MGLLSFLKRGLSKRKLRPRHKADHGPNVGIVGPIQTSAWESEPGSHIQALPWELVLEILEHANHASVISFILTCRLFYISLKGQIPQFNRGSHLADLLRLLDRDIPDRVFCHLCFKLVRWNKSWKPTGYYDGDEQALLCRILDKDGVKKSCMLTSSTSGHVCDHACPFQARKYAHRYPGVPRFPVSSRVRYSEWSLTFPVANLVMRRHLRGPEYGFSLSRLAWVVEHSSSWQEDNESFPSPFTSLHSQSARIIDDELYIRRLIRFRTKPQRFCALRSGRELKLELGCEHLNQNREWQEMKMPDEPPSECYDKLYSCKECRTDSSITNQPLASGETWSYEVASYVNLGSCQVAQEWEWSSWAESTQFLSVKLQDRVSRYGKKDMGSSKRRWVEAASKDEEGPVAGILG